MGALRGVSHNQNWATLEGEEVSNNLKYYRNTKNGMVLVTYPDLGSLLKNPSTQALP